MQITAIDEYKDLFCVEDVFDPHIVDQVIATDWLNKPWQRQEGQESWARRRIDDTSLSWTDQWHRACQDMWTELSDKLGIKLAPYSGTAWWLDEPGFTCDLHTDGEMAGSMQLTWVGALPTLGTCFYNYKDPTAVRHCFPMRPNSGYIMINRPDATGYRHLQWHGMLTPVPQGTYRLNSYTWITPL